LLNALSLPVTAYVIRSLGASGYGQWAVSVSVIATVTILTNLGLRGVFIRSVAVDPGAARGALAEQLGLRLSLALPAAAGAVLTCAALGYAPVVLVCTTIGGCGLVLTMVATTVADLLQALHRLPVVASINFLAGLVLTIASVVAVGLGAGPVGLSLAYLLGPMTAAGVSLWFVHRNFFPPALRWNPRRFWALLRDSRYFAAQQFITAIGSNAELLLVPKLLDVRQLGLFAAGLLLADRLLAIPDGIGSALYPVVASHYRDDPKAAARQTWHAISMVLMGCVPLSLLITLLAGPIAQILTPRDPDICRLVIQITAWGVPFAGLDHVMTVALNAAGRDAAQARLSVISGPANVVTAVALVGLGGLPGACVSWVARFPVRMALRGVIFLRTFPLVTTRVPVLRLAASNAVMAGAVTAFLHAVGGPAHGDAAATRPGQIAGLLALLVSGGLVGAVAYAGSLLSLGVVAYADLPRLLRARGDRAAEAH
jgi:O-antigen/teichoic acid export membrane protein